MDGGSTMSTVAWTPERLHARYAPRIARHVRAVLRRDDEREDLVQDVLITVFLGIGRVRDPTALDQWVAQITRIRLRHLFRVRRTRRHASLEALPETLDPSFQMNVVTRDLATRAMDIMQRLPESDRRLLTSFWFGHVTLGAIAAREGVAVITVRRRLSRARTRFAKLARRDPALAACLASSPRWATSQDADSA